MALTIISVEIIEGCGIIVLFSDLTRALFPVEELLLLRPYRQPVSDEDAD